MCGICLKFGLNIHDENGHILNPTQRDFTISDVQAIIDGANIVETHPGETKTGSLNNESGDLIAVELVAGQTYSFSYRSAATNGVSDPYLMLLDGTKTVTLAQDDDGGQGRGSQITFTATTTGTHYLLATSWYHVDPAAPGYPGPKDNGDYVIDIWAKDATHDAGDTVGTATAITTGTTFGYLDSATDVDFYKINVKAGQVYTFAYSGGVSGAADYNGEPGENIGNLRFYDAAGNPLGGTVVNYETGTSYFAKTDGQVFVRVTSFGGTSGGYTLDVQEVDPATRDPLESLNWDSADDIDTVLVDGVKVAYVYFAPAGENFGEKEPDGVTPMTTYGWQQHQIDAVMHALSQYTPITGIEYRITTDVNQAEFRMLTTQNLSYGARFYPQDPSYGTQQGIGTFNLRSGGFGTDPNSLLPGGYSYEVILHEFGHAHGIAHPHDTGGGSEIMLGVSGSTGSYGVYDLNQGVYTVMSYNSGWITHPDGTRSYSAATRGSGWNQTLGAFDIAVLQARYGVHAAQTGDNVYTIADTQATAAYRTIWDTAGTDTINYVGTKDAQIDLLAATLDYTPTGGGVLSFARGVWGGYTIANGVVIENATGGSGNDTLLGNSAANVLTGNGGNDSLTGREGADTLNGDAGDDTLNGDAGADTLNGGAGNDILNGGGDNDTVNGGDGTDVFTLGAGADKVIATLNTNKTSSKLGMVSFDVVKDFDGTSDKIDLSGIDANSAAANDQAFAWIGTNANKSAGTASYKVYDSINGAESALGFDIDGVAGVGSHSGKVTVVMLNVDGGSVDHLVVLLGAPQLDTTDFTL